jgi:predicted transcriptional regulator
MPVIFSFEPGSGLIDPEPGLFSGINLSTSIPDPKIPELSSSTVSLPFSHYRRLSFEQGQKIMTSIWLGEGRRSSIQIAAAVLKLSNNKETTKSELMDSIKMSHQQTQKYLDWLVERQLINIVPSTNRRCRYRSTLKGQTLISILDEVQQMLLGR